MVPQMIVEPAMAGTIQRYVRSFLKKGLVSNRVVAAQQAWWIVG